MLALAALAVKPRRVVAGLRGVLATWSYFEYLGHRRDFGHARVLLQLVTHVLMGFKRLRDRDSYADDPLVCRVLGVSRVPEGTAVGYNPRRKGARSPRHMHRDHGYSQLWDANQNAQGPPPRVTTHVLPAPLRPHLASSERTPRCLAPRRRVLSAYPLFNHRHCKVGRFERGCKPPDGSGGKLRRLRVRLPLARALRDADPQTSTRTDRAGSHECFGDRSEKRRMETEASIRAAAPTPGG